MSDFRKLDVYNKALEFVCVVYKLTEGFPKEEQFSLTSQLKRAASSICLNIAEGSGRFHKKDFVQFLRIALGSSLECSSLLDIALRLSFVSKNDYERITGMSAEIGRMLNGLINSLTKN